MTILEAAIKYLDNGIPVIPAKKDKRPDVVEWGSYYKENKLPDISIFKSTHENLALICGNGIEAIDFDLKFDISGTLFKEYCELVASENKNLLSKLVVQSTKNNGYHFIYKCDKIDGNLKLASRCATDEEIKNKQNEKSKTLIETRGHGGYIIAYPSINYKLKKNDIFNIPKITIEERNLLFNVAYTFNTYVEEIQQDYKLKKIQKTFSGLSPFDDYNERGDIVSLLEINGWKVTKRRNSKFFFKRDGSDNLYGAEYCSNKKVFYVFTENSNFESKKGLNHSQVYTKLLFDGEYSDAAKQLLKDGYGERQYNNLSLPKENKIIIINDYISTFEDDESSILSFKNGTLKMGLTTGFTDFDIYFRFKEGNLVPVNGHANVGKTTVLCYFMILAAILHDWKWIVYSSENRTWSIRRKLMEFYLGIPLIKMTDLQYKKAKNFISDMFTFIKIDNLYSAAELIDIACKIKDQSLYKGFLIDPYNSLKLDFKSNDKLSSHEYHYEVASMFRLFANSNNISTYLNCHAVTEALRRKEKGYPVAPYSEDTEGGGKFVNRADDFLTIHRLTQHPDDWMISEIHVRKIKEYETGGRQTPFDNPFKLKMLKGNCQFENDNGENPIMKYHGIQNEKTEADFTYDYKNSVINQHNEPEITIGEKAPF